MDALAAVNRVDQVAHLALQVGRLLLINGADTEQVEAVVVRFCGAYGCTANLLVNYEALLVTVVAGEHFRTKLGHRVPGLNVGMHVYQAVMRVVDEAAEGQLALHAAAARLDAIEHRRPEYPGWIVMLGIGATAASLSRLFGGDWGAFGTCFLAGAAGTWLRQQLASRAVNPVLIPFAAACLGAAVGGCAVRLGATATPTLCLVAPGMILVPGVPLINGVQDMLRGHVTLGIGRLGFAALLTVGIALGLFVATLLTGVAIPVDEPGRPIGLGEDAAFSALAALGYALLFSVPAGMAWACLGCGVVSHAGRTFCLHLGIDIISATLIGALAAGVLAQVFARWFDAPAATFSFPGVVAMVPGAYAFRAVIGALAIAHGAASAAVLTETVALGITVVLMVLAIAIGVAAPVLAAPLLAGVARRRVRSRA